MNDGPETLSGELSPALIRILERMNVDRPSVWSPSFEGLTPVDLHVLALADVRPGVILKELLARLCIPNSTLTGVLKRLEEKGLLRRETCESDRRAFGLYLTDKGRSLRNEQFQIRLKAAAEMLAALDTDGEREAFVGLIRKIAERM